VEFIAVAGPSSSEPLDAKAVHSALKQSILSHFGDAGWGAVGFSLTGLVIPRRLFFFLIRF